MAADANAAGQFIELYAILAVVLGGTSLMGGKFTIAGTVIGVFTIQTLEVDDPVPRRALGAEPGVLRGRRDHRGARPVAARAPLARGAHRRHAAARRSRPAPDAEVAS